MTEGFLSKAVLLRFHSGVNAVLQSKDRYAEGVPTFPWSKTFSGVNYQVYLFCWNHATLIALINPYQPVTFWSEVSQELQKKAFPL